MKRFDWYAVIVFLLLIASVYLIVYSWWFIFVSLVLILQFEFVQLNVRAIVKQCTLYDNDAISDLGLSKIQLWLKKFFAI